MAERPPIGQRWSEPQDAADVVMAIMTMHWDLGACQCWVCRKGRELGLHPTSDFLDWRAAGIGSVAVAPTVINGAADSNQSARSDGSHAANCVVLGHGGPADERRTDR